MKTQYSYPIALLALAIVVVGAFLFPGVKPVFPSRAELSAAPAVPTDALERTGDDDSLCYLPLATIAPAAPTPWIISLRDTDMQGWLEGFAIQRAAPAGYLVAAAYSRHGIWIANVDQAGALVSARELSGAGELVDMGKTSDGGAVILHKIYEGLFGALKLDKEGAPQWARTYNSGREPTYITNLATTADGGFAIAGRVGAASWLMKLQADGSLDWLNSYSDTDHFSAVAETADGSLLVAASGSDLSLLKVNADGSVAWHRKYHHHYPITYFTPTALKSTADGGMILAGYTERTSPAPYGPFAAIMRLDADGNILWQKAYGGETIDSSQTRFNDIEELDDGGFLAVGKTFGSPLSLAWVVRLDAQGDVIWQRGYGSNYFGPEFTAVSSVADGLFGVTGYAQDAGENFMFVLQFETTGAIATCPIVATAAPVFDTVSTPAIGSAAPTALDFSTTTAIVTLWDRSPDVAVLCPTAVGAFARPAGHGP